MVLVSNCLADIRANPQQLIDPWNKDIKNCEAAIKNAEQIRKISVVCASIFGCIAAAFLFLSNPQWSYLYLLPTTIMGMPTEIIGLISFIFSSFFLLSISCFSQAILDKNQEKEGLNVLIEEVNDICQNQDYSPVERSSLLLGTSTLQDFVAMQAINREERIRQQALAIRQSTTLSETQKKTELNRLSDQFDHSNRISSWISNHTACGKKVYQLIMDDVFCLKEEPASDRQSV